MDWDLFLNIVKMLIALPIVLFLAYLSMRLGKKYMSTIGKSRNIKVLETIPIHSKSHLSIVNIGKEYLVIGTSEQTICVLKTLSEEEVETLLENEEKKKQLQNKMQVKMEKLGWNFRSKNE